ncbi:MAG: DUF7453 family protein, partial [Aeoliella sp.]
MAPVARAGQQSPGAEPGVMFVSQSFEPSFSEQTRINASGQVAFQGFLTGSGVTTQNNSGTWSNTGGNVLQLVARDGGA